MSCPSHKQPCGSIAPLIVVNSLPSQGRARLIPSIAGTLLSVPECCVPAEDGPRATPSEPRQSQAPGVLTPSKQLSTALPAPLCAVLGPLGPGALLVGPQAMVLVKTTACLVPAAHPKGSGKVQGPLGGPLIEAPNRPFYPPRPHLSGVQLPL